MQALPALPTLSEEDLIKYFGDDSDGIRRYRLVHAVLHEEMTQREAAELHQLSERTVRNVLHSYAEGGLEALRSRRGGRQRKESPAEQALIAAMAQEPNAGGDRLWHLAQELLGEQGASLSRRTAYRILARLRNAEEQEQEEEDDDAPDSLRGLLRSALPLLAEDPPLQLGESELARHLIPDEEEPLMRGVLLQQAIRDALDQLRPPGAVSVVDRSWWPYLICTGEYEAGQRRADLEEDLALSASTYSRAKRQGINTICALLPQIISERLEAPLALASQRLPRTPGFVGRRDEEAYYAWRLQNEGIAHIWGLPGSGKTALAAELAAEGARYGQTILWHICNAGPDATQIGIIRGLAKALAAHGDELLWQTMRSTPPEEYEPRELLALLYDRLLARPAVVVLDDVHRVDHDEAELLFDTLAELVVSNATRLLLVGRRQIESLNEPPLLGLSEQDARLLWVGAPTLPPDQWWSLYDATGGLPALLQMVVALYRRSGDLVNPQDWADEVETWTNEAIWQRLSADEQRLTAAAYALYPRPWAMQAAQVCEALGIPLATFSTLRRRAVLIVNRSAVACFGALRLAAAALLREDVALREQVAALALSFDEQVRDAPQPEPVAPTVQGPILDQAALLARVREVLQNSANYLHGQSDDPLAHQLAAELELLQQALRDPLNAPAPLVRMLGQNPHES